MFLRRGRTAGAKRAASSFPPSEGPSRQREVKIFVVPYDGGPQYQDALYSAILAKHGDTCGISYWRRRPFLGVLSFFFTAAVRRGQGYRIAHIHWWIFYVSRSLRWKRASYWSSRAALRWLLFLRYRIVWTVHNLLPHEAHTSDDPDFARRLASNASRLIVHSKSTLSELADSRIDTATAVVIPQGSYIGRYQPSPSDPDRRAELGLRGDDRLFLFFGLIRDYKGVGDLLIAQRALGPHDQLCIVGRACDQSAARTLDLASTLPRLHVREGRVPDDDVASWFSAADVVCFPFRRVTTSASVVLALSFGRPIVAPRLGALNDLPPDVGYFYEPTDPLGLRRALADASRAPAHDVLRRGRTASEYAESLSWPMIAERTWQVYSALCD